MTSKNLIKIIGPEDTRVDIYNSLGQKIKHYLTESADESVACELSAGNYLVKLNAEGHVITQKIIIQ